MEGLLETSKPQAHYFEASHALHPALKQQPLTNWGHPAALAERSEVKKYRYNIVREESWRMALHPLETPTTPYTHATRVHANDCGLHPLNAHRERLE